MPQLCHAAPISKREIIKNICLDSLPLTPHIPHMTRIPPHFSLSDMDSRARDVFRDIVETFLSTGQPVGSRTLALESGLFLSPATIRNTMSDLTRMGLLASPHVSAGRIPTHRGLRLFVDGLLQVGNLEPEQQALSARLSQRLQDNDTLLTQASTLLAGLAGGAGLVLTPSQETAPQSPITHVEFIALDDGQALVVLVYADGRVENRLMPRLQGLPAASLERAGDFLSARLKGRQLGEARRDILADIETGRAALDAAASKLIEQGLADWTGTASDQKTERRLIIRGQSQLLGNLEAQADIERIQMLFDDLERKEGLIDLLDQTQTADGVKIFIGSENPLFSLSDHSVVIAPYRNTQQQIIGAVGVIGPTRINYAKVIPMVDYTAQLIGKLIDPK